MMFFRRVAVVLIGLLSVWSVQGQTRNLNVIADTLTAVIAQFAAKQSAAVQIKVLSIQGNVGSKLVDIRLNEPFSYLSFQEDVVKELRDSIRQVLPKAYKECQIRIYCDGKTIEGWTRYTPENKKNRFVIMPDKADKPWVRNVSRPYELKKGLQGRHIALWHSHGLYFSQRKERWQFQRPALFSTIEDLLPAGFVLPFLVPMLESAGAVVALPRERDFNPNEVVVDNDDEQSTTLLNQGAKPWSKGGRGFGYTQKLLLSGENPFVMGSFLQCETTSGDKPSEIQWIPVIPEKGTYAVYVSYKSVENSITDARYTVFHRGGKTEFWVNQRMGSATWVYLGSFLFDKGYSPENSVVLSSKSKASKGVVTADAVRFGGGMGNIARNSGSPDFKKAELSGYSRAVEGARYWLQWAGMPDSIYNNSKDVDDYKDDINSRPLWVNYLSGGSRLNPKYIGLRVPLDLSMGFHTDASSFRIDSVVGTLGIYTLKEKKERFLSGQHSLLSRDLTDWIQSEILHSVLPIESRWKRRGMWNKRYAESRIPEIPTTLLELLSHQNYFDMKYGSDPHFRFVVSRAIYKGMLKYFSTIYETEYQVQPLPVEAMKAEFVANNEVKLSWSPVVDSLESSALPKSYILYQRIGEGGFDNGTLVADTVVRIPIQKDTYYSFKVTAWNEGGESFPSEVLSTYLSSKSKGTVLVVNGFTRLSAPVGVADTIAGGFDYRTDAGVPYGRNYSFTGFQVERDRLVEWTDNDAPGFGASYLNFVGKPIHGNSFDYTLIHGKALVNAGYSYTSCSEKALPTMDLDFYSLLDFYYGKQKETTVGNQTLYPILSDPIRKTLSKYLNGGGTLLLSGAYLGSESWRQNGELKRFMQGVLMTSYRTSFATASGEVRGFQGGLQLPRSSMYLPMTIDGFPYSLESVDALEPNSKSTKQILIYADGNKGAGTMYKGKYAVCVLGFPFEAIQLENDRTILMGEILRQLK